MLSLLSTATNAQVNVVERLSPDLTLSIEGLVRAQQNTGDGTPGSLDPICTAADGQADCGGGGTLSIPFNTRSYFQGKYDKKCAET